MPDDELRTSGLGHGPVVVPNAPLRLGRDDWPRMRMRWMVPPVDSGWDGFALSEWELTAAGWSDRHTHTETNLVVAGELHVECAGETVVARTGDTVTVPVGLVGRYWAPRYARMYSIYGPNPQGHPHTHDGEYWHVEPPA
jgi:hypothetical protein